MLGGDIKHFTLGCILEQGFIACLLYPGLLDPWEQLPGDARVDKQPSNQQTPT